MLLYRRHPTLLRYYKIIMTSTTAELTELIQHVSTVRKLAVEQCATTKEEALSEIKSFVDSKIKETVHYINSRIKNKIKTEPSTDYILINNIDVFNSWEPKLSPEELLAYNQYYNILRCDYTLLTLKTYKYGDQFAKTKNDIVKSVLDEVFEMYHKQGIGHNGVGAMAVLHMQIVLILFGGKINKDK